MGGPSAHPFTRSSSFRFEIFRFRFISFFFVDTFARKPTGNIGVQDVADVHQATVRALEKHAELLDADQVP